MDLQTEVYKKIINITKIEVDYLSLLKFYHVRLIRSLLKFGYKFTKPL